jgi:hypothetical protein
MKAKIRLDTMKDINQFVAACAAVSAVVHVTDGGGLKVSAKSILGVMYAMEFNEIWCECEQDIYGKIERFVVID